MTTAALASEDASAARLRDALLDGRPGPEMIPMTGRSGWVGAHPDDADAGSAERPRRRVRIDGPIALASAAVDFALYDAFAGATGRAEPDDFGFGRGAHPAVNVSWLEAAAFCAWLSEQTGRRYFLPSEALWEVACRAGTDAPFHTGWSISPAEANFDPGVDVGRRDRTVEIGALPPNAWGFHEMHGNVSEWCADRFSPDLSHLAPDGAAAQLDLDAEPSAVAVVRGGGWSTKRRFIRASDRYAYAPDQGFEMVGFRVACAL